MSTLKQKLAKAGAITLTIVLALLVGSYLALKTSLPDYDQTLSVSGLTDDVEIIRDANAIPHVFAGTLAEAYFGLGFAHAQDRLWQLELTHAASNGRLSEIFGEATLAVDKLTRTVDSADVARLSLARMSDETKRHFQRYVDGINSYITHRTGLLPPEFLLFSVEPSLWKLEDTAKIFALIGLGANNWQQELKRAAMQQHLSDDQIAALFPAYPAGGPLTHKTVKAEAAKPKVVNSQLSLKDLPFLKDLASLTNHPLIASYPASNTWVIDGRLTKSGKPLLASDPHGPIKAPADYYLAHLSGPDFDITGVGYVGMPVFAIGHNRHIAWGLTDIIADMADLYAEKTIPGKSGYYQSAEGEKPFITRQETIKVKGQEDVVIQVRSTDHGPVISDVVAEAEAIGHTKGEDIVLVLSTATFSRGNISAQAFMRINQAHNWRQFKAAMGDYEMSQNLSYADTQGNIGIISSATVPLREAGDGFMITPGWTVKADNRAYLRADQMPFSFNPKQGYLVNANNKIVPSDYPYFFSREDGMPYRAERILHGIIGSQEHSVNSMIAIQGDIVSQAAKQLLPLLLNTKPYTENAANALSLLSQWDTRMDRGQVEPLLYMTWEHELTRLLLKDELKSSFNNYFASRPYVITQLLNQDSIWCDNIDTPCNENCATIVSTALHNSLATLAGLYGGDMQLWQWGEAHQAQFTNDIFTHVPLLNYWSDITLASDGGPHTVNTAQTSYNNSNHPFNQNYGPRYRQVIDLSDLSNSRFMITPGVSGNFLSPYYGHLAERWRNQRYIQLETDKSSLLKQAIGITHLSKKN